MRAHGTLIVAALAAVLGLVFATFSTYDFVQHLDRQVHGIHCSYLPGLDAADVSGETGCHVTLMSPYSSVLRTDVWGGVPIALPAMSVFAFLAFWAGYLMLSKKQADRNGTLFNLLAWTLPVLTSAAMGYLSVVTLGAACKLCIGIYAASALGFVSALLTFLRARKLSGMAAPARAPARRAGPDQLPDETIPDDRPPIARAPQTMSTGSLGMAFAVGIAFVLVPVVTYAATAPDFSRFIGSCGQLADPNDPNGILLPIGPQTRAVPVIEILDPLCPACRGFEQRFDALDASAEMSRRVLLFPLDDACNWMVSDAIHPGACAISEAVLCADGDAKEVLAWAFDNQERIVEAERAHEGAASRMARDRFPALAGCLGRPPVQAKLNAALRWAVQNQLPILTPQVYVGQQRVCDADTDLGMDYALTRLVTRFRDSPPPAVPPSVEVVQRPSRPATPTAPTTPTTTPTATPTTQTTPATTPETPTTPTTTPEPTMPTPATPTTAPTPIPTEATTGTGAGAGGQTGPSAGTGTGPTPAPTEEAPQ